MGQQQVSHAVLETWDAETRERAQEQAQGMGRDRDAQAMLQAHIAASSPLEREANVQSVHFRPLSLYARVAHFFPGFSDAGMRRMHYPRFFGYIREANAMIAEQNNRAQQPGTTMVDDPELAHLMLRKQFGGKPAQYQGETVPLND